MGVRMTLGQFQTTNVVCRFLFCLLLCWFCLSEPITRAQVRLLSGGVSTKETCVFLPGSWLRREWLFVYIYISGSGNLSKQKCRNNSCMSVYFTIICSNNTVKFLPNLYVIISIYTWKHITFDSVVFYYSFHYFFKVDSISTIPIKVIGNEIHGFKIL